MKVKSVISKTINFILYTAVCIEWIALIFSLLGSVIFALLSEWEMCAFSLIAFSVSFALFILFMIEPKDAGSYHYDEYY